MKGKATDENWKDRMNEKYGTDGIKKQMTKCTAKTEVYSRVTGFYRPIENWNPGKTKEFEDRKPYNTKEKPKDKKENLI